MQDNSKWSDSTAQFDTFDVAEDQWVQLQLESSDVVNPSLTGSWRNVSARPEINVDRYRRRVREKFGLPTPSCAEVSRLSRLERALSESNAGLRQKLAQLSAALNRSDALCASEAATREALDEKFSHLMQSLPIGVIELDSCGHVRKANPAAKEILGQSVEGCAWFDVVRQTFKPQADDGFEISTTAGRRISVQTQSLDDRAGQLILLNDHTDTRALQARLAQSDRLAALGRTAATLAHQVRTPVCGALLYLTQALRDFGVPNKARIRIERAVGRLEHLERQVKQILLLAKGEVPTADHVLVSYFIESVSAAIAPIQTQTACNIHVISEVGALVSLRINQEALVGCVVNLVENAVVACESGEAMGAIEVTFRLSTPAESGANSALENTDLVIVVADNGPGMDSVALANATKPFFTSRADGTGLGLSMVQTVVKAYEGSMTLRSTPGCGTAVTLTVPASHVASPERNAQV